MKRLLTILAGIGLTITLGTSALAAPPEGRGKPKPGGGDGGSNISSIGLDISWPQCGRTITNDFAFAIVGVNGGIASTANPCLAPQLAWAKQANNSVDAQDPLQLYVNTGNPWDDAVEYSVTTWPTDNIDQKNIDTFNNPDERFKNPYKECVKTPGNYLENTNSLACSWQYGWERAVADVHDWFTPAAQLANVDPNPANYFWWLDVETENSWQAIDTNAKNLNRATLEGMTAYIKGVIGARVGIYSTGYQFGVIVGDSVTPDSNLYKHDSWLAGARNSKDALSQCQSKSALTGGGQNSLVQYISKNLDHNISCL